MELTDIMTYFTPVVTAIFGWWAGRRKQRNDFISELQASIDLLAEKNKSQMEEIINLRNKVVELMATISTLTAQLAETKQSKRRQAQ